MISKEGKNKNTHKNNVSLGRIHAPVYYPRKFSLIRIVYITWGLRLINF